MSTWPRNSSLRGSWPIATNTPVTSRTAGVAGVHVADPHAGDLAVVAEDLRRPPMFHSTLIFGLASARSAMILLARNSSRRWMIVTSRRTG